MPNPDASGVYHFYQERIPELRFEWHPETQICYVIQHIGGAFRPQADAFAWTIKTHGDAWNAVLIWCRGYIAHKIDFANLNSIDQREEGKSNGSEPVHP